MPEKAVEHDVDASADHIGAVVVEIVVEKFHTAETLSVNA